MHADQKRKNAFLRKETEGLVLSSSVPTRMHVRIITGLDGVETKQGGKVVGTSSIRIRVISALLKVPKGL